MYIYVNISNNKTALSETSGCRKFKKVFPTGHKPEVGLYFFDIFSTCISKNLNHDENTIHALTYQ